MKSFPQLVSRQSSSSSESLEPDQEVGIRFKSNTIWKKVPIRFNSKKFMSCFIVNSHALDSDDLLHDSDSKLSVIRYNTSYGRITSHMPGTSSKEKKIRDVYGTVRDRQDIVSDEDKVNEVFYDTGSDLKGDVRDDALATFDYTGDATGEEICDGWINPCSEYLGVEDFAKGFVNDILEQAKSCCKAYDLQVESKDEEEIEGRDIVWPKIGDFMPGLGGRKILEYLEHSCDFKEAWKVSIIYVSRQMDEISEFFFYKVIFSLPTKYYPIAQVTVTVYFEIEVCKAKPIYCPVSVTYITETYHQKCYPGKNVLQEETLLNVLRAKLAVFRSIYY